ncbi:hypothetical protein [Hyphomicrobium sp. ghe19]|uniref:hypothetical protein n=1 Tax=Hyphomicrobium sp. ghe19 TaxID=2682968 RepID=UPI001366E213|nr:hypothetical protein HYPP_03833 [Hyphomicrobium sp. ghe19]
MMQDDEAAKILTKAVGLWMTNEMAKGVKPADLGKSLSKGLGTAVRWYASAATDAHQVDVVITEIAKPILADALFSRAAVVTCSEEKRG